MAKIVKTAKTTAKNNTTKATQKVGAIDPTVGVEASFPWVENGGAVSWSYTVTPVAADPPSGHRGVWSDGYTCHIPCVFPKGTTGETASGGDDGARALFKAFNDVLDLDGAIVAVASTLADDHYQTGLTRLADGLRPWVEAERRRWAKASTAREARHQEARVLLTSLLGRLGVKDVSEARAKTLAAMRNALTVVGYAKASTWGCDAYERVTPVATPVAAAKVTPAVTRADAKASTKAAPTPTKGKVKATPPAATQAAPTKGKVKVKAKAA